MVMSKRAHGIERFLKGPAMKDYFNSFAKYSSMTSGCSKVETRFLQDNVRFYKGVLHPSQKPDVIPEIKKCVSLLSG